MKFDYKTLLLVPCVALLAACVSDRVEQVESKMQTIRQGEAQPVSPPPVFESVQSFNYSAEKLRNPFMPPTLSRRMAEESVVGSQVVPDESRPKEQLEQFDLTQLVMRGVIQESSGEQYALVEDPTGTLFPARVGNYMGKNHGRIVDITAREISLIEVVPDGGRGYVERPKTILAQASE